MKRNLGAAFEGRRQPDARVGGSTLRSDPIKTSIHLDPTLWGKVERWRSEAGTARRKKISFVSIVRVLLEMLTADDDAGRALAEQVRKRL